MKKSIVLLILTLSVSYSQHKLPFASVNNSIELAVANSANSVAKIVMVEVVNAPEWLGFANKKTEITELKSGASARAIFTFSVDKSAPVGLVERLQFVISSQSGEQWTKEIAIKVSAPEQFELFQNYPNPFNPSTTIGYQLPVSSVISLKVFDILGKEIATLDEGVKEAGYHLAAWNAGGSASGMYLYQISFKNQKGEMEHYRKKLLLLK